MPRCRTAASLLAQAEAKGYNPGAHREEDAKKAQRKHNDKTKRHHRETLNRYILWRLALSERDHAGRGLSMPREDEVRARYLARGTALPDLDVVKDWVRFYIATSQPTLTITMTTDSMGTVSEWFFAGFEQATGTVVPVDYRTEVYSWQRSVLVAEGLLINKRKPKHNFTVTDLVRLLITLWTKDDLTFIPERYRIQFTFIIRVYCWTGARIGAFFTNGLRYRDVELVLQRTPDAPWRIIYKIDQRWVKNNRDPENIVFGTALHEHDKFIFDDIAFLLPMVFADKALFGYNTLADLMEQRIPVGQNELILRWENSMLDKPILRQCTLAGGVTNKPMPRSAFSQIFQCTLLNAGYLCQSSVHSIRRELGKKVDEIYTEVQRSQHLTQADPRIFGQAYVANTSSVDGQGAFLGEVTDHHHIDYFQGLGRFREQGLPCELPARLEEGLKQDKTLQKLEAAVRQCPATCLTALKQSKQELSSYRTRFKRTALHDFQEKWIQERRDWQIMTRGREQRDDHRRNDMVHTLSLLFPERRRIARLLATDGGITSEERWLAMEDLRTLCTRDFSVLYLPGHQPRHGCCPVKCCQTDLDSLPKNQRNQHIQSCTRREIASKGDYLQSDVHYCYWCFNWVIGSIEWQEHCRAHGKDLGSKRCGNITYCHTLVRPGYCPFCLGQGSLQSWCRDAALWKHVDTHLEGKPWPQRCPHPLCDVSCIDSQDFRFHLIDDHGFSRVLPPKMDHFFKVTTESAPDQDVAKKRKLPDNDHELTWLSHDQNSPSPSLKRARPDTTTITPSLLLRVDDKQKNKGPIIDLTTPPDSPIIKIEPSPLADNEGGWKVCDDLEPDSMSQIRFQSRDSTLVDRAHSDDDFHYVDFFSDFIRSPSSDPGSTPHEGDTRKPLELMSPQASTATIHTTSPTLSPSLGRDGPEDFSEKAHSKIQIRLRLEPPRSKITLRLPAQKRRDPKHINSDQVDLTKPTKRVRRMHALPNRSKSRQIRKKKSLS